MTKPIKYYQYYWNCNGFIDKFDNEGWAKYFDNYKPIVDNAVKWCNDKNFKFSGGHPSAPFIFTFHNFNDLILFKLCWGGGKILMCYEDGGYGELQG